MCVCVCVCEREVWREGIHKRVYFSTISKVATCASIHIAFTCVSIACTWIVFVVVGWGGRFNTYLFVFLTPAAFTSSGNAAIGARCQSMLWYAFTSHLSRSTLGWEVVGHGFERDRGLGDVVNTERSSNMTLLGGKLSQDCMIIAWLHERRSITQSAQYVVLHTYR